jgi:hypothetical protein
MARAGLFATIRTEGLLLPSDTLALIGGNEPTALPGLGVTDYHLGPGETFSARITRSWNTLLGYWAAFRPALAALPASDRTATSLTRERWLLPLFRELGCGWLQPAKAVTLGDVTYPVSHSLYSTPVHLVGARVPIGERTAGVRGAAGMSPHSMVQELLNRSSEHLWGVVSNGLRLRLLRDNASLTRQAFVEWDLESLFDGQVYPDFVVLWKTLHQSRFEGERPADCWLERWANEASARGVRALEDLRDGVQKALEALGRGFVTHPENGDLRAALAEGRLNGEALYRQLLRVVYRLIFLAVAEDRDLLHPPNTTLEARSRYERYYSLRRLRHLAERRTGTLHGDLWQSLNVVRRSLDNPNGLPTLGLAGLGSMLWSYDACRDLENAQLPNRELLEAVRALSLVEERQAHQLRPVDYRNLGPEELGSVYESLLELHPRVTPNATNAADTFTLGSVAGNERKRTGSYYTPSSLIACLLDSALEPVLDEAAAKSDPETALLRVSVLDPACGSGHFLIAAAHRIARRVASVRTGEPDASPEAVRTALRDVIGRCIHGVDLNPMAAELCKVSLWMEALDPGKPLSFLEHRIVVGNALLGATPELLDGGIPDDAFVVLTGDDKDVVSSLKKRNKAERKGGQSQLFSGWDAESNTVALARQVAEIDSLPDDSVEAIRAKEHQWALLDAGERRLARLRADAWCAAFMLPKRPWTVQFTDGVWHALVADPTSASQPVLDAIERSREKFRFLHWHVEFADVIASGGFDVVLGNPPWDRVKLSEKEFFAARAPQIASAAGAKRRKLIADLRQDDPPLWDAYQAAVAETDAIGHFLHNSGRYPLCGVGDVNTYAVFAETMRSLVGRAGRAGAILPTGIATDDTTKAFFGAVTGGRQLASLYDFENKDIFPSVHSSYKFCLLTLSGRETPITLGAELAFFCHSVADLDDPKRRFRLSSEEIELLNPNTLTCPVFRSRRDAEITLGIYHRVPVLIREGVPNGDPWGIQFRRLFDMTNDSGLFRTQEDLEAQGFELTGNVFRKDDIVFLPLYEGKMVDFFDHRAADVVISATAAARQRQPRYLTLPEHQDPSRLAYPQAWVGETEVDGRLENWRNTWMVGFSNVTSPTNERTMIPGLIPRCAVGNSLPLMLPNTTAPLAVLLAASLSSFVLDFVARQKVGGINLNFFLVEQFPVLPPATYELPCPWDSRSSFDDWLLPRVVELTYTASDLAGLAHDLGYEGPPFAWDEERRAVLRAELDACFFHLYGLERDDVDHVLDTFPIVERHDKTAVGEYRTKRLILEVYDAQAKAAEAGQAYVSSLDRLPSAISLSHATGATVNDLGA